jgi:hypothetical protein
VGRRRAPVRGTLSTPDTPPEFIRAIDELVGTEDVLVRNDTEWRLSVGLAEYETSTQRMLSTQRLFEFPVRFVP